jgi:hypothetical protein
MMMTVSGRAVIAPLRFSRRRYELAVTHSLDAYELFGKLAHATEGAAHDQHLKTVVFVEVNVKGRSDQIERLVLKLGELRSQVAHVMIIDE